MKKIEFHQYCVSCSHDQEFATIFSVKISQSEFEDGERYSASSLHDKLQAMFCQTFKAESSDFVVRAPGRVNLIGSHIDYCGYSVLSMAIERDILFAVKVVDGMNMNQIDLHNADSHHFPAIHIDFSSSSSLESVERGHWSRHFLAALQGVGGIKNICNEFKSMQILVDANIPKESGLSSSSAFVCGSTVSLLFANLSNDEFSALSQTEIASLCIECERNVGVDSEGMDQTICMTANVGHAKYIDFIPELIGVDVALPSNTGFEWVISHSLADHQDSDRNQNQAKLRVFECRLAAVLLAKLLNIKQWRQVLTLRDIENITSFKLDQLLFRTMDLLHSEPYSLEEIEDELECEALGISLEDLMVGLKQEKQVLDTLRTHNLALQQRALHVYSEANRVRQFKQLQASAGKRYDDEVRMMQIAKLMNASHLSCKNKFECSCCELDELQSLCLEGGAVGACLTGTGWAQCCLSLVPKDKLNAFKSHLNKNYYASISSVPLNHLFATSPSQGLTIFLD